MEEHYSNRNVHPVKNFDKEVAPAMMRVTFHLKDFVKSSNPAEHKSKVISFVQDYAINPSVDKSICDKESLDEYGVMPSQKGKVTEDELFAIVGYMYDIYDNQKLLEILAEKQRITNMPLHERVIEQNGCANCHDIEKDKIAPSFKMIANRYEEKDREMLIKSIKEGSKGKWEGKKLPMVAFTKMSDKDVEGIVNWILKLK
jgi:cytochrome c